MPPTWQEIEPWLKVITAVCVIIALFLTLRTHAERSLFDMIDKLYGLCHTLETHALRDWYLGHLFCIGEAEYEQTKLMIRARVVDEDPPRYGEYAVKEKLFAIHVFVVYEQVYYQWVHSSRFFQQKRRRFLKEILSYFTDRLLVNPRLIAFLESSPNGASIHLEQRSKQYLDEAIVRLAKSRGLPPVSDPLGPFAPPA